MRSKLLIQLGGYLTFTARPENATELAVTTSKRILAEVVQVPI